MQKGLSWYGILLKENLKKRTTWLAVCTMLLLLYTVSGICLPASDNLTVGICAGKSETGRQLMEELQGESSWYRFIEYPEEERLYRDVQSGQLECAFVFSDQLDQKLETGKPDNGVMYLCSPYTTKGEVAKETVFAAFFRLYSGCLLEESGEEIFVQPDKDRKKEIQKKNENFLESDFFRIERILVNTKEKTVSRDSGCYPIQGIFGLFLLGFMYFANGRIYETGGKWVSRCFSGSESLLFSVMQILAAVTLPALAGIALLLTLPASRGMTRELIRLVSFVAVGSVWTAICAKPVKSAQAFAANGFILLLMTVLIYPVFQDITLFVPAAEYVRYLTPFFLWI
ncbi:MAG: hypothetical protein PUA77_09185 [Lachnospiraceae bacterium]|nr:hypothetical protein [Lachnospiraceae bacterium]